MTTKIDYAGVILDHAAEQLDAPPASDAAAPTAESAIAAPATPAWQPSPPAATKLTGFEARIILQSRAGEDLREGPRWGSLAKAAEQCARVLDDGAPIRSTFRDEAPVQSSASSGGAFGGREDVLAFVRALEGAYAGPHVFGGSVISPLRCRLILEWRLCGRVDPADLAAKVTIRETEVLLVDGEAHAERVAAASRGAIASDVETSCAQIAAERLSRQLGIPLTASAVSCVDVGKRSRIFVARAVVQRSRRGALLRVPVTSGQLAGELADVGVHVTDHQVGMVYAAGARSMRVALERAGMLRPSRRRERDRGQREEGDVRAPGMDLEGWKEISAFQEMAESTARKLSERDEDPMPVVELHGRIYASREALDEWTKRQMRPRKTG